MGNGGKPAYLAGLSISAKARGYPNPSAIQVQLISEALAGIPGAVFAHIQ
jgi:hypothetical protein